MPRFKVKCRKCGMEQSDHLRLCRVRACWNCGSKEVVGVSMAPRGWNLLAKSLEEKFGKGGK